MKLKIDSINFIAPLACTLTLLLVVGCNSYSFSGMDDGEEHLEHHIPEHKPESFRELVAQLENRMQNLLSHPNDDFDEKQKQLREIIDWIPELAADSELKHREWNEV